MVSTANILNASILIVDDLAANVQLLEQMLSGVGYAAMVALRVIDAVSQPYDIEGHAVSITISAGVGLYPTHGEDAGTLLKSADLALYEAKRAGKNAYRISEPADPAARGQDGPARVQPVMGGCARENEGRR